MQRIKTYLSDGSNPNGRLFAPDLNNLQDAVAALTDLTQHISVADLAIGESSLLLSRSGAGIAQLAGQFLVSSGVSFGTFTTTQRDALPSSKRPTGLVIFNSTTGQLEINLGSSGTPSWQGIAVGGAGSITGRVGSGGAIIAGTGFSVAHPSSGVYTVTFTTPFAAPPTVQLTAEQDNMVITVNTVGTNGFGVTTHLNGDWSGGSSFSDTQWNFLARAMI